MILLPRPPQHTVLNPDSPESPPAVIHMLLFINSPPQQWAWWASLFQGINVIHRQPGQPPALGPRGRHWPFSVCWSRGTSDCLKGHSFKASPQTRPSWREARRKWMKRWRWGGGTGCQQVLETRSRCSKTFLFFNIKPSTTGLKKEIHYANTWAT